MTPDTLARRLTAHAAAVWTVGILAATTAPFDVRWSSLPLNLDDALRRLHWRTDGLADVLANIALYFPLGALTFLTLPHLQRGGRGGSPRLILTTLAILPLAAIAGFFLSCFCEWIQFGLPLRVASASDVAANTAGALAGAVSAALLRRPLVALAGHFIADAQRRPLAAAARIAPALVVAAMLWPFDAALTPPHIYRGLRRAEPHPLARWNALAADPAAAPRRRAEYLVRLAGVALTFTALAALTAAARTDASRLSAAGRGLAAGALTAALCGAIGVFLQSQGLDTLRFFVALFGAAFGATFAPVITRRGATLALLAVALYNCAHDFAPMILAPAAAAAPDIQWRPLAYQIQQAANFAARDLGDIALRFVLLGACLAAALRPRRATFAMFGIISCALAYAAAVLLARRLLHAGAVDVTFVVVAGAAAGLGAWLGRRLATPHFKGGERTQPIAVQDVTGVTGELGFEPRLSGPEPLVLPLHHSPMADAHCSRTVPGRQ